MGDTVIEQDTPNNQIDLDLDQKPSWNAGCELGNHPTRCSLVFKLGFYIDHRDLDQKPSWSAGCKPEEQLEEVKEETKEEIKIRSQVGMQDYEPAEQLKKLNCLRSLIASDRGGLVSPSKDISKG